MAEIKKMGYCVNGEWKESKAEKYMDVTDSSDPGIFPLYFLGIKKYICAFLADTLIFRDRLLLFTVYYTFTLLCLLI